MADWWMKSGTTSTDDDANSPHMGGGTFVTGDYDPLSVTSEKASNNLNRRTVAVTAGSTSGTGFTSTSLALWTAPSPCVLTQIRVTPMTAWQLATCGTIFEFWSCVAGAIATYNASSTSVCKTPGDVHSCFTINSTGATLGSCETVRVKVSAPGTTSCAQVANFQLDYLTSG